MEQQTSKNKTFHSNRKLRRGQGGYKDIDIDMKISSLKVKWVTRLMDNNFHSWKIHFFQIWEVL